MKCACWPAARKNSFTNDPWTQEALRRKKRWHLSWYFYLIYDSGNFGFQVHSLLDRWWIFNGCGPDDVKLSFSFLPPDSAWRGTPDQGDATASLVGKAVKKERRGSEEDDDDEILCKLKRDDVSSLSLSLSRSLSLSLSLSLSPVFQMHNSPFCTIVTVVWVEWKHTV